jgi:hypothetical protein
MADGGGQGTNTKSELMGAWATLHIAKYLDIENLRFMFMVILWLLSTG